MGHDASQQPPDAPDVLLHETVAGWIKKYLQKEKFNRTDGLEQGLERLKQAMADCKRHINQEYDVEGLCRSFPGRLQELVDATGQRLCH